jgi:hypothetical protein
MKSTKFLSLLLVALLLGCSGKKKAAKNAAKANPDGVIPPMKSELVAEITKTPCFGPCQVFTMQVFSDGKTTLLARSNMPFDGGMYTAQIIDKHIQDIKEVAKDIDFFSMENVYDSEVQDFPTIIIKVIMDGKEKTVSFRHGFPRSLKRLEAVFDTIVETSDWNYKGELPPRD